MKKKFTITLVLISAIALMTACGGGNKGNNNQQPESQATENTVSNNVIDNTLGNNGVNNMPTETSKQAANDLNTVEGILANFNLSLDQVMPDGMADVFVSRSSGKDGNLGIDFWIKGSNQTSFNRDSYKSMVFDAVKGIADDGKNYQFPDLYSGNKVELTEFGSTWCIYFKGKVYSVRIMIVTDQHPEDETFCTKIILQFTN